MTAIGPLDPPISGARHIGRVLGGAAISFAILQGGLTLLVPGLGMTWTPVIVTAAMFAALLVIERVAFGRGPVAAFRALGFGRPRTGAMVAAVIISAALLMFFPLYSLATGVSFSPKADWLGLLIGSIALNGIAEETLFRGFVFGHLRQAGHSFRRAGTVSLVIFGAIHLFLLPTNPLVIVVLATFLAVVSAFPYAFLFERAGSTIWAGALLHVAGHAVRFLDMPEEQVTIVASAWTLILLGAVFLVYAFRNSLLRPVTPEGGVVVAPAAT